MIASSWAGFPLLYTTSLVCHLSHVKSLHHHHHLSRSCHCWQMASTTCAMHFDPGPFSSIDCQRLPRCHLSISFWVFLLVVFHLWVSTLMLFSPTWCSSFWLHVLPTVLSCTSLFLLLSITPVFDLIISFLILSLLVMFNNDLSTTMTK